MSKQAGTGPSLTLHGWEVELLGELLSELAEHLGDDEFEPTVLARLYPAGHRDDDAIAAEFHDLTRTDLQEGKQRRAADCLAQLGRLEPVRQTIALDDVQLHDWLRVLNDLRLILGVQLGVAEDDEPPADEPDGSDPEWARRVYWWLGALQDGLVQTAMRSRRER